MRTLGMFAVLRASVSLFSCVVSELTRSAAVSHLACHLLCHKARFCLRLWISLLRLLVCTATGAHCQQITLGYRETYAAEEAVQLVEKRQQGRDLLIEHLSSQIDAQGREMEGLAARHAAEAAQLKAAEVVFCANPT